MDYYKTLSNSELIELLGIESDFKDADMVGELLLSRQKKMSKQVVDFEKTVKMYKGKCFELSNSLEEAKKKASNELKEKVFKLEGECRVLSEREKKAVENVGRLTAEVEKIGMQRIEELAIYKGRWASGKKEVEEERKKYKELEKLSEVSIGKLEKDLEVHKAKCADLGSEIREEKKRTREMEGVLEEFKKYKMVSKELEEKVTRLEKDCEVVFESEKKALEKVAVLSGDLEKMSRKRNVELGEFKRALECEKQKAENEMKEEKKRYTELEKKSKDAASKLENDLNMQKQKCSELSVAVEEKETKNIDLQSKLEEFKQYETMCRQLKDKVACLEENYKIVGERKKSLTENNSALLAALEKVRKDSEAELTDLKTKNKDLECAKVKAEDKLKDRIEKMENLLVGMEKDLDIYKARCSDLSTKLDEEKQRSMLMEVKHEEFDKYKADYNELKEKVTRLEEECKIISEREKSTVDRITNLTDELDKTSMARSAEFDELDKMKSLTEELTKVSLAKSVELDELKEKYKNLECAKQKVENEVTAQKNRYKKLKIKVNKAKDEIPALISKSSVPAKAKCEVGDENKEGKMDKHKEGIVESKTNEPLNAATSPKLKIKLKDPNCVCDGEAHDHMSSVSVCNSEAKSSGGGPVPVSTFKRKRTSKSRKSDGGSADPVGIDKEMTDHNKAMTEGPDGEKRKVACSPGPATKKRKVECSPVRHPVTKETSNRKPGSPPVENSQEKAKLAERQSKRTIHPPVRLDL